MEVYLKKINQTPISFSENELKEFTNGLSSNEKICLQYLTAKNLTRVSISSFNQSFNNYVNGFLMNKDVNILLIYRIKLNYYIVNAIKAEPNQYSFMQADSIKIDTENLSESENTLITNPSVLEEAYKLCLKIMPKLNGKDEVNLHYKPSTRSSYIRALEAIDKSLGISIFSSFIKTQTLQIIDNLFSVAKNKSNETVNKINNDNTLTSALETYKYFLNKWLGTDLLDLNGIDNNDSEQDDKSSQDYPLNMILYGAPGTGKTYKTIDYAVAIVNKQNLDDVKRRDRDALMQTYHGLCAESRIAFTTFHHKVIHMKILFKD